MLYSDNVNQDFFKVPQWVIVICAWFTTEISPAFVF